MPTFIQQAALWTKIRRMYLQQAGIWNEVKAGYKQEGGAWVPFFRGSTVMIAGQESTGPVFTGYNVDPSEPSMGSVEDDEVFGQQLTSLRTIVILAVESFIIRVEASVPEASWNTFRFTDEDGEWEVDRVASGFIYTEIDALHCEWQASEANMAKFPNWVLDGEYRFSFV